MGGPIGSIALAATAMVMSAYEKAPRHIAIVGPHSFPQLLQCLVSLHNRLGSRLSAKAGLSQLIVRVRGI